MDSFTLPPTPNWYDIGVAACAPDNTYLYASLGDLVVIQQEASPKMKILYKIHKDRVFSINVNPEWGNPEKLVVTTGKDKNVNVFDLNTWRPKASHAGHTTRKEIVVGATFCGSDRIVSVSESGFIILWKISDNELTSLPDVLIVKDKVTCLSACPHESGVVAFGYKRGTILVTDLRKKGRVLYRLMRHSNPIIDLAWCPVECNIFPKCDKENRQPLAIKLAKKIEAIDAFNNPDLVKAEPIKDEIITSPPETPQLENPALLEPSKEYLLASSALGDSKIVIWRAFTNGTVQTELRLAKTVPTNKRYHSKPIKDNNDAWISLAWVTPSTLLSSSFKSELLQWNFSSGLINGSYKSTLVHNDHKSKIFSIKAPIKFSKNCSPTTLHTTPLPAAWTLSKDRLIINSALSPSCEILSAYPTIAGQVNVLSVSKINPARLAISVSEDVVRLMDLSSSNSKIVMMNTIDKIPHKIAAMTWHPKNENLLTFGTFDGVVGSIDTCQVNKGVNFYVQYRNSPVVTLDWGPMPDNSDALGLYVAMFGELVMFDPAKPFAYPKILLDDKSWVSYVAWKPNYEVCAVGNKFGHISLFNKKFECLTTTYIQSKQIRSLVWHPHVTAEDTQVSPCNHWLAASANEIVVYDLQEINFGEKIEEREKQVKVVAKFPCSAKTVTSMDWSPHKNGKLVAITDVPFITVWNVKTKEVMASIKADQYSMFSCVIWSSMHDDFVISGGKGNTLRYWKVSENLSNVMGTKMIPPKSKAVTNGSYEEATNGDSETEVVDKFRDAKSKQRPKYMLALLAQNHSSSDIIGMTKVCVKLFNMRTSSKPIDDDSEPANEEERSTACVTKLFGTKEDVEDILKMEIDFHSKKKYTYAANHLSLWDGSIEDQITKAINSDTVTNWHVNMAPMVSHQFWRVTCEAYAKQLAEEGPNSSMESASYFLACNKITEAINVLCEHNKHREALLLAKIRLVPEDSRITEILDKFAKFSEECGNYEIAAQCYIAMDLPSDALKALIRRVTAGRECLEFCLRLAQHCDEKEIFNAVSIRLDEIEKLSPKVQEKQEVKQLPTRIEVELALHEKELELHSTNGNLSFGKHNEIVTAYNQRSTNIQDTLEKRLDQTSDDTEVESTETDIENKDESKIENAEKEAMDESQEESEKKDESDSHKEEVNDGNDAETDEIKFLDVVVITSETQHFDAENNEKTDESELGDKCDSPSSITNSDANAKQETLEAAV